MTLRQPHTLEQLHDHLRLSRHLVFLTGAGISAAAGIPTFRGPTGLYGDGDEITAPVDVADLLERPEEVERWHNDLQAEIAGIGPTAAHRALSRAAVDLGRIGGSVTVATMNGDDLHEKAGTAALHLHGSFLDVRCEPCRRIEVRTPVGAPCPACGVPMRPHVVAFGENIDGNALWATRRALPDADLFIAVGLSGQTTAPIALTMDAARHGVPTVAITLDPAPLLRTVFGLVLDVRADVLDGLLSDVGTDFGLVEGELSERLAEILG